MLKMWLFYILVYMFFIFMITIKPLDKLTINMCFLLFIFLKIGEDININDDFSERLHCIIIEEENSVFLPGEKVNLSEVGTFIHEHKVVLFSIHWKHWKHLFQSNKQMVNYLSIKHHEPSLTIHHSYVHLRGTVGSSF